jgi:HD superfamily phosphohydrolase YqeK
LARERRISASIKEEAFTAGILHDAGKVLQAANSPEAYSVVLADAGKVVSAMLED